MPSYRLASALVLLAGLPLAQAATVIDNANGYTLNAKGDVVQVTALAFDDAGCIIARRRCATASSTPRSWH